MFISQPEPLDPMSKAQSTDLSNLPSRVGRTFLRLAGSSFSQTLSPVSLSQEAPSTRLKLVTANRLAPQSSATVALQKAANIYLVFLFGGTQGQAPPCIPLRMVQPNVLAFKTGGPSGLSNHTVHSFLCLPPRSEVSSHDAIPYPWAVTVTLYWRPTADHVPDTNTGDAQ
jgi:hypothetical protein